MYTKKTLTMAAHAAAAQAPTGLPRRFMAVLGAAAVIPLTIAPLAPALAHESVPPAHTASAEAQATAAAEAATADAYTSGPAETSVAAPTEVSKEDPAETQPESPVTAETPVDPETSAETPTEPDAFAESSSPDNTNAPAALDTPPAASAAADGAAAAPDDATRKSAATPEAKAEQQGTVHDGKSRSSRTSKSTSGPQVTANRSTPPASGWYRGAQPIRFVADDPTISMRSITVVIDGRTSEQAGGDVTVTVEGNGEHTVEYWGTDVDGRSGAAKSLTVAIDGLAPRFTTSAPRVIQRGDDVQLGLDCWDEHSGVQNCVAEGTNDGALPSDELGEHSVALFSLDNAGNEASEIFTYRVEDRPVASPELEFHVAPAPASGWYRGPVGIIISATTEDPADRITGVHWWSRGPVSASGSVTDENGIAFEIDANGVTQVTYTATTARGGFHQGEATIRIDSVQPEIRFTGPGTADVTVPKVVLGSAAQLTFECADAHSGVDFCGEELPLLASGLVPPSDGALVLDTTSLGSKTVVIESADVAGNRAKATFEYEVVEAGTEDPGENPGEDPDDGPGGQPGGQPQPKPGSGLPPVPTSQFATGTEQLARTGSSWAPLGAIGVAIAAAGGAIALMRLRERD